MLKLKKNLKQNKIWLLIFNPDPDTAVVGLGSENFYSQYFSIEDENARTFPFLKLQCSESGLRPKNILDFSSYFILLLT